MPEESTSMDAGEVDGRRVRGQQRRADIIDATLAVITRDGAAGVTHRTVAREAGMAVSLSTYYFATLDDLLIAALTTIADEYTQAIDTIIERSADPLDDFACLVAASSGAGRERAIAERELATLAARRPALRPIALRWRERVAALAHLYTPDETSVANVVAAADGLCATILIRDEEIEPGAVGAVLRAALGQHSQALPTELR